MLILSHSARLPLVENVIFRNMLWDITNVYIMVINYVLVNMAGILPFPSHMTRKMAMTLILRPGVT